MQTHVCIATAIHASEHFIGVHHVVASKHSRLWLQQMEGLVVPLCLLCSFNLSLVSNPKLNPNPNPTPYQCNVGKPEQDSLLLVFL